MTANETTEAMVERICRAAKAAAPPLARSGTAARNDALRAGQLQDRFDAIVIAEMSTRTIMEGYSGGTLPGEFAGGIGDDCVSTLFLAHDFKKPFLIAPAMNSRMLAHPAVQRSISVLKGWGVSVLGTGTGRQACGDSGPGRMLEPGEIHAAILKALKA